MPHPMGAGHNNGSASVDEHCLVQECGFSLLELGITVSMSQLLKVAH